MKLTDDQKRQAAGHRGGKPAPPKTDPAEIDWAEAIARIRDHLDHNTDRKPRR